MSHRPEKVASLIKRVLAQPVSDISKEINTGFATLTAVRLSKDLQSAKLYISLFGSNSKPGALLTELENRKGELRHIIAREIRLKAIPDLKFFYDDTLDQIEHIQTILDTAKGSLQNDISG